MQLYLVRSGCGPGMVQDGGMGALVLPASSPGLDKVRTDRGATCVDDAVRAVALIGGCCSCSLCLRLARMVALAEVAACFLDV